MGTKLAKSEMIEVKRLNGAPGEIRTPGLLIRSQSISDSALVTILIRPFTFNSIQACSTPRLGESTGLDPVNPCESSSVGWAKVGHLSGATDAVTRWKLLGKVRA